MTRKGCSARRGCLRPGPRPTTRRMRAPCGRRTLQVSHEAGGPAQAPERRLLRLFLTSRAAGRGAEGVRGARLREASVLQLCGGAWAPALQRAPAGGHGQRRAAALRGRGLRAGSIVRVRGGAARARLQQAPAAWHGAPSDLCSMLLEQPLCVAFGMNHHRLALARCCR